ncbi:MAG: hypothetical protein ACLRSV_03950 [Oscillospiraceae bacterium]
MIPVWVIALLAALGAVCLALPLHIGMTGICLLLLAAVLLALRILKKKNAPKHWSRLSDRSDRRRYGGDLRRNGVYCRAGTGQRYDAGRDAGVCRRARRAGTGRRAVADAKKAAG